MLCRIKNKNLHYIPSQLSQITLFWSPSFLLPPLYISSSETLSWWTTFFPTAEDTHIFKLNTGAFGHVTWHVNSLLQDYLNPTSSFPLHPSSTSKEHVEHVHGGRSSTHASLFDRLFSSLVVKGSLLWIWQHLICLRYKLELLSQKGNMFLISICLGMVQCKRGKKEIPDQGSFCCRYEWSILWFNYSSWSTRLKNILTTKSANQKYYKYKNITVCILMGSNICLQPVINHS